MEKNHYLYTKTSGIHFTLSLRKILFFFQFDPQTLFLGDQVIFKEQLISNSYEMVGLEDEG
jgi:hypothetical protein